MRFKFMVTKKEPEFKAEEPIIQENRTEPLISVIIPIYNVERYLYQCVESVAKQTMKGLEIICVNDGSKDNSLAILKELAEKYANIKIIDKENGGYGKAINAGLDMATGDYIGIVESDDIAAPDMFETLYRLSKNGTVDVVKANFWDYYDRPGKAPEAIVNKERASTLKLDKPFTLAENPEISWGHPSVWSAIYRREFLSENGIRMIEAKGGGWVDNPFFYETLSKAKSIMWTDKPVYYYRKTNENSSSNAQTDPNLPFVRMNDNLDVLDNSDFQDAKVRKVAYARALMYMRGAFLECDYSKNFEVIDNNSQQLMRRLDRNVMQSEFNLKDQKDWITNASPLKTLRNSFPKVLIYNWIAFDNPKGWGGGVTLYCKNLITQILKQDPNVTVYFLSSGFVYDATTEKTYVKLTENMFGDRVRQFELVNSPVPSAQDMIFKNPTVAFENPLLKETVKDFMGNYGPFSAVHFNNIEGLSLDVLDLKEDFPDTKFLFSIHNYVPMCATGFYFQRHNHCNCNPAHSAEDCLKCTGKTPRNNIVQEIYERGIFNQKEEKCISSGRWLKALGLENLDTAANADDVAAFAKIATEKLNKNCDKIFAVSKRVYDIAAENGFDESKMVVQYIGTKIAEKQLGHSSSKAENGLKIVFLGNDINYEEKGYPFLLDALSQMEHKYASRIDLVLTVRQAQHSEIYTMLKNFRSVKVIQGYTHGDLPLIFKDCNLSLVPVLWEDNLPQIAIESVAYGVPVLASTAGGASELCGSELFKFEGGNAEELNSKIIHFLENPDDLGEYWKNHNGLVTMQMHWDDLRKYYNIPENDMVKMSREDYSYLLDEHEFLLKNVNVKHEGFAPDPILLDLRTKLQKANEENQKLKAEIEDMEKHGEIVFQTQYDPIQGDVGADMFKLTLDDFNYNNFYAEIDFVKLENKAASMRDTLRISGTWHNESGELKLYIHQTDWEKGVLAEWVWFYIKENSVYFFGRYPGHTCGFHYSVRTLTSRSAKDTVKFEAINSGFITENEVRDKNAWCAGKGNGAG